MQNYYNENLLNLKGVTIEDCVQTQWAIEVSLNAIQEIPCCPICQSQKTAIHDYRTQKIQHFLLGPKLLILTLKKRRFVCKCCQKRFTETYDFVGRYQRRTKENIQCILHALKGICAVKSIAKQYQISGFTVQRIFSHLQPVPERLPITLCIDEFKGNAGHEKYQCILVDGVKKNIYDILPSRNKEDLHSYFSRFSKEEKARVRYVVMDMCQNFANIARTHFPNARIVADKFHFARQCFWALENTRKRVQNTLPEKERLYFKRSKSILRKHERKLDEDQKAKLSVMKAQSPDICDAHILKEQYVLFLDAKTRKEAEEKTGVLASSRRNLWIKGVS
ncbi:MAG: ISL3 family transposase [Synergistaceae bacterium]|nr:ISL3 family transposase [Synergistaceae bacterium]NLY87105.1 ISL3 family transposase [Clostridiales bacterium]